MARMMTMTTVWTFRVHDRLPAVRSKGIVGLWGGFMTTEERLENIERLLEQLLTKTMVKSWYTVDEFALLVGRSSFTCREWCGLGRINAEKSMTQAGSATTWSISQAEYLRYQREGLLPLRNSDAA